MATQGQNVVLCGDENNNNPILINDNIKLKDPPASFRSFVWKYFGFKILNVNGKETTEKERTVCKICFSDVSYKTGNTSNMSTHLSRKHAITSKILNSTVTPKQDPPVKTVTKTGQLKISDTMFAKSQLPLKSPRAQTITKSIAGFIAKDMRPYSIIENVGFINLIATLEPRYSLPSRTHFSTKVMPQVAETVRVRVSERLQMADFFAITTDGWTSRSTQSYNTITVHFVNQCFDFENYNLQTRILRDSHTGLNLAEVMQSAMGEWNLKRNLPISVTTDNASNIVLGVSLADGFYPHIRCFAHTINLATQRGISVSQLDRVLGKVRRVVTFFHKSSSATALLKSKQELLQIPDHKLIGDVQTRWNSTFDMIERYIEQQAAIFATLMSKEVKKNVKEIVTLTDDDVTVLEDVLQVLKPLKTVTTLMCDTKHPTLSLIHPLKEMLCLQLSCNDQDSSVVKAVKGAILKDLKPRYTEPAILQFLLQSSAVDPRFKSLPYIDEEKTEEVFHNLYLRADEFDPFHPDNARVVVKQEHNANDDTPALPEVVDIQPPEQQPSVKIEPNNTNGSKNSALDALFGDVFVTHTEGPKSAMQRLQLEIVSYQTEKPIPLSSDPLEWWKVKAVSYPILARMARYYLGIPATSVASERVFSTAGDIVSAQRAALSPDNVDMLIFLKCNINIPGDLENN